MLNLKLSRCPTCSLLLPFPIAVPGFLGTLAALGTSRRKVDSHQRLAALPFISLIPSAPCVSDLPHDVKVHGDGGATSSRSSRGTPWRCDKCV